MSDVTRWCPACNKRKPISQFGLLKRCSDCRKYAREWNRARHAADPDYREKINSRVRERSVTEPAWRAQRTAELQANKVRLRGASPGIGDSISTSCVRCDALFTYECRGSRPRTLCDLCVKHRQEWLYYRISGPEAEALRAKRACEICGATKSGGHGAVFRIDHCHETGAIRGVLCHACNIVLGIMKDDPARLRAVADYIESHQSKGGGALQ